MMHLVISDCACWNQECMLSTLYEKLLLYEQTSLLCMVIVVCSVILFLLLTDGECYDSLLAIMQFGKNSTKLQELPCLTLFPGHYHFSVYAG